MQTRLKVSIGFSTTTKIRSRIIRWFTRSKVSHAWVAFYDDCLDTRVVLQAETWGYELRPWNRWKKENILIAEYLPLKDADGGIPKLATHLGSAYDWKAVFLTGLANLVKRWWRKKTHDPRRLMCSESVLLFLSYCNFSTGCNLDPELTSPSTLMETIDASTEFEKIDTFNF